jgi:hypothetical protein
MLSPAFCSSAQQKQKLTTKEMIGYIKACCNSSVIILACIDDRHMSLITMSDKLESVVSCSPSRIAGALRACLLGGSLRPCISFKPCTTFKSSYSFEYGAKHTSLNTISKGLHINIISPRQLHEQTTGISNDTYMRVV